MCRFATTGYSRGTLLVRLVDGILTVHKADECPATGMRKPCDEFEMLFYKVYFYYDEEGTRLEHVSLERKENRKFL